MTAAEGILCTYLVKAVVCREVKAVSVSGLRSSSSRLHLLALFIQHHLQDGDVIYIRVSNRKRCQALLRSYNLPAGFQSWWNTQSPVSPGTF